ncbi:ATP-binding protein [Streptomyces sp. T1317-0309]|nr:ATP-binding protein [Streptomyces sp. T1317-0309]
MTGLRLRGRDREVVAVREALDAVRGGRGGCVVVEGTPGVGKSRLLAELDEMARRLGFDVVSVRADELDQYAAGAALQSALQSSEWFRPSRRSHRRPAALAAGQHHGRSGGPGSARPGGRDRGRRAVGGPGYALRAPHPARTTGLLADSVGAGGTVGHRATDRGQGAGGLERLGARWLTLGPCHSASCSTSRPCARCDAVTGSVPAPAGRCGQSLPGD